MMPSVRPSRRRQGIEPLRGWHRSDWHAVQDGNYEDVDPKTGKRITIAELIPIRDLKVDSIFWCTQEPYYSENFDPFLSRV